MTSRVCHHLHKNKYMTCQVNRFLKLHNSDFTKWRLCFGIFHILFNKCNFCNSNKYNPFSSSFLPDWREDAVSTGETGSSRAEAATVVTKSGSSAHGWGWAGTAIRSSLAGSILKKKENLIKHVPRLKSSIVCPSSFWRCLDPIMLVVNLWDWKEMANAKKISSPWYLYYAIDMVPEFAIITAR